MPTFAETLESWSREWNRSHPDGPQAAAYAIAADDRNPRAAFVVIDDERVMAKVSVRGSGECDAEAYSFDERSTLVLRSLVLADEAHLLRVLNDVVSHF
jgi:hypothetical protein